MANTSSIVLLVCFALMACFLMTKFAGLVRKGHQLAHYAVVFHALASLWMLLRTVFWLMDVLNLAGENQNQLVSDLVFWLPHSAMFLTFSTLALFLLRLASRRSWSSARKRYLWVFGATAVINVAGIVALAIADNHFTGDDAIQNVIANIESAMNSVLFCVLAGVFGWIGLSLLQLGAWEYQFMFLLSPRSTSLLVWVLACIFVSRSAFNLLTALDVIDIDTSDTSWRTGVEEVGLYTIWELTPLLLLLATIASERDGHPVVESSKQDLESFGVFGAISQMEHDLGNAAFETVDAAGAEGGMVPHTPGGASSDTVGLLSLGEPGDGGRDAYASFNPRAAAAGATSGAGGGLQPFPATPQRLRVPGVGGAALLGAGAPGGASATTAAPVAGGATAILRGSGGLGVSGGLVASGQSQRSHHLLLSSPLGGGGGGAAFAGGGAAFAGGDASGAGLGRRLYASDGGSRRSGGGGGSGLFGPVGLTTVVPGSRFGGGGGGGMHQQAPVHYEEEEGEEGDLDGNESSLDSRIGGGGGASRLMQHPLDLGGPQQAQAQFPRRFAEAQGGPDPFWRGDGGGGLDPQLRGPMYEAVRAGGMGGGAGFLTAQQNAARRTAYLPPSVQPLAYGEQQQRGQGLGPGASF